MFIDGLDDCTAQSPYQQRDWEKRNEQKNEQDAVFEHKRTDKEQDATNIQKHDVAYLDINSCIVVRNL